MSDSSNNLRAIILAAGKGERMGSDLPKVMHPVAGKPIVQWVVDACHEVGVQQITVVVGYGADVVRAALDGQPGLTFVEQNDQLGTGHAVDMARSDFAHTPAATTFVLCGDGPLIRASTLRALLETHLTSSAAGTLATAIIPDPTGYGRIIRNSGGDFQRIIEHKDATDEQREIAEVNPSYYCFNSEKLFEQLARISNDNAGGEYYLTDVFQLMLDVGEHVGVVDAVPPEDVLSINTMSDLQEVEHFLLDRFNAIENSTKEATQ
jgi:bifunctional UDP-N-acetylglucosamine pyrophosphorylase/glucosamine-1-phosphate N-acetyltransferase